MLLLVSFLMMILVQPAGKPISVNNFQLPLKFNVKKVVFLMLAFLGQNE